jgi:phosphoribosylformylglycinamidine synthase PurS subunit
MTRSLEARILVRPKPGILDPQGEAVQASLRRLGFTVSEASVGRVIDVRLEPSDAADARLQLERMCEQLLTNPLIETYELHLEER